MNNKVRYYAGRFYCLKCKKYYWDARQAANCKHAKDKVDNILLFEEDDYEEEDEE